MRESIRLGKQARAAYAHSMAWNDPERWLAHYVGGMWRAPIGTRMAMAGALPGRVVLACQDDLDRADAMRRPTTGAANAVYAAIVAQVAGPKLRHAPPDNILNGAVFLAHPQDADTAIALALQVAQAGLPPGCFALLYADHR